MSDGQDGYAYKGVEKLLSVYNLPDVFTIHTFGFGLDHDAKLMNHIAELQGGNFYNIDKIEMINEAFVSALGGLMSVVGQQVSLKLTLNNSPPF